MGVVYGLRASTTILRVVVKVVGLASRWARFLIRVVREIGDSQTA